MGWRLQRIADRYILKAAAHLNKLITTTAAAAAVGLNALYSIGFSNDKKETPNMHDIVYRQANEMHVAKFAPSLRKLSHSVSLHFFPEHFLSEAAVHDFHLKYAFTKFSYFKYTFADTTVQNFKLWTWSNNVE